MCGRGRKRGWGEEGVEKKKMGGKDRGRREIEGKGRVLFTRGFLLGCGGFSIFFFSPSSLRNSPPAAFFSSLTCRPGRHNQKHTGNTGTVFVMHSNYLLNPDTPGSVIPC
jgi:hypothetical protein